MNDLFIQLRQAHRLCSSAYNRIFPLLAAIPEKLNVEFEQWHSHSYDYVKRKNKPAYDSYGEALLTLYDSVHVYSRNPQKSFITSATACVVGVRLVMDSAGACDITDRHEDFNQRLGKDILSDPAESKSLVIFYVYRPAKRMKVDDLVNDLFYSADVYPYPGEATKLDENDSRIQVANFVYDMSEWVSDSTRILDEVRAFIDSDVAE